MFCTNNYFLNDYMDVGNTLVHRSTQPPFKGAGTIIFNPGTIVSRAEPIVVQSLLMKTAAASLAT